MPILSLYICNDNSDYFLLSRHFIHTDDAVSLTLQYLHKNHNILLAFQVHLLRQKASEFLDFHLKRVMQNGASYIKDSNDFMNKVKNIDILNDALLVTADVVGLYPSILYEVGLRALGNALENRNYKEIPTENLIKMAEFFLKNDYFEFDSSVFQ